ncbi:MAG: copper transport protein [Candidatus Poriferisodalaceae bacterium]|jgi:copper transport protein
MVGIGGLAFAALVLPSGSGDIHSVLLGTRRAGLHLILGVVIEAADGADLGALQLAMRFSVVAAIALAAAGAAGVVLAVLILDSVSGLWSTPWGRLLLLKVALVSAAASAGAYNHFGLIPMMERVPNDEAGAHKFRVVVTAEAVALITVAAVTAFLVAAAS